MKNNVSSLLIILLFLSFSTAAQSDRSAKKLIITYTKAYCGGAKPSDEILEDLNQPRPLANCNIKLIRNNAKKAVLLKTNDKGEITTELMDGTYFVFIGANSKNKAQLPFNKKCKKVSTIKLADAEIKSGDNQIQVRIPCDPCDPSIKMRP